jgi:branched-chain amino acid aminotransferase
MALGQKWSQTWTFYEGDWHQGNIPIMGTRSHAAMFASSVFDGARTFEGVTPDLDLHCARVNASAKAMHLLPLVTPETWAGLAHDGIKRFAPDAALYIRPTYWAEYGGKSMITPDPDSTQWCLTIWEAPMRAPEGNSITLSSYRKPTMETAPCDAKAGCLYPNNGRGMIEARARGFDTCVMCDMLGNVAEFGSANLFMAKDGVVFAPAANGAFLNGITRQRVIGLLRGAGVEVVEAVLTYKGLEGADEIFSSGNYAKVSPVNRIDMRSLQPGPLYRQARELYWAYAHG